MQSNNNKENSPKRVHSMSFKDTTSLTKQSFKKGTGIDQILKQYQTLGVNDLGLRLHSSVNSMAFGNFDSARDYQTKLNTVIRVNEYFKRLPSGIRDQFQNQPGRMIDFMSDPKNHKACQDLGLFPKDEPKETPPAPPPAPPNNTPK